MQFKQTVLDNGLEVVAEVNDAAYSVAVGFFVKTGARDEMPQDAGVSHFLEHMAFKGTSKRSAEEVNRRLDELGADSNACTSEEQTVYFASLLPDLQDEIVELLGDILRPTLREDDFETEKQVILEEIKMYEDQPPFGADETARELFFAGHPLGNSVLGTAATVSDLSVDRMRQYFERQYAPKNIVLAGTGRIDFDRFVRQAESVCGSWRNSEQFPVISPIRRRIHGTRGIHQIVRESAAQQYILLLSDSPGSFDEDRFAAEILANIIGDDVGSRLYWELIDSGIADQAGLASYEFLDNGFYATGLSGEPDVAGEILERTRAIYQDVQRNGLTQKELDRSKTKILSRLVLGNERPGGRLFSVGAEWAIRREYCSLQKDLADVAKLTLSDIHAVLEHYPLTDPFVMTIGPLESL